jgi:twitching motility protein PilI
MARKLSLQEYQRGFLARIARSEAGQAASKMGLLIGDDRWLVDLADAGGVVPVPPVATVPLTQTWFAGVANIRGNLYSVVDLAGFLGGAPITLNNQSRLLLISPRYRMNSGLLVSRMLGLYRDDQLQPDDGTAPSPWTMAHYKDRQANSWKQLNVRELVAHPDFFRVVL